MHMTVEDLIAEGDTVVARVVIRGTHRGEYMGLPATGKQIEFSGFDCLRIVDGKFAEHWGTFDQLSMMQQLGALPAPR
jgi:predicted ester cyclase